MLVIYLAPLPRGFLFGLGTLARFRSRLAELMPPFQRRPPRCLARNCLTVRQFGPLESIDPNDAMILPHGANPDRMKFSERTGMPSFKNGKIRAKEPTDRHKEPDCRQKRSV